LVIYLGYVPWDVPGFSVDEHLERLSELAASPGIAVTQRRFRIHATKP
jgi:methyltransferase type 11